MVALDEEALLRLFARLPADERKYAWNDFVTPHVCPTLIGTIEDDRILPILALDGRQVVGAATLDWHGPVAGEDARARLLIDHAYRGRGLGAVLLRELVDFAFDGELRRVSLELPVAGEPDLEALARRLGFEEVADTVGDLWAAVAGLEGSLCFQLVPGEWCACGHHTHPSAIGSDAGGNARAAARSVPVRERAGAEEAAIGARA
jgi:GNAT superfamily N-acetyltransferase